MGCTMGLTLGYGAWQIDRPSNGSMWDSYSFQPVGQWMVYSFTDLGAEGCCRSLNALLILNSYALKLTQNHLYFIKENNYRSGSNWPNSQIPEYSCSIYPKMLHSEQNYAHFCSEWRIVGHRIEHVHSGIWWKLSIAADLSIDVDTRGAVQYRIAALNLNPNFVKYRLLLTYFAIAQSFWNFT